MNVFVIVVTYNGRRWYDKCFSSLRNSSVPVQTIVIDNASTDDTVSFIKDNYPEIHLIESNKNLGFGKANNIGFEIALKNGCDYVYLLNQDAWLETDTLEILINVSLKNSDYGIISPMQITANGDKLDKNFADYSCRFCPDLIDDLYFNKFKEIYEIKFVMAAHWLISRKCLMTVGGFSSVFTHYGEDNNLCDRTQYHGLKAGICPLTRGIHDREFRQKRIVQQEIYMKYVRLLVVSTNINLRSHKRCVIIMKDILFSLFTLKFIRLLPVWFRLLRRLPDIYENNRRTRNKIHFLNIK